MPDLIRSLRSSSDSVQSYVIRIGEGSADSAALSAAEGLGKRSPCTTVASAMLYAVQFKLVDYVIDRIRHERHSTVR